MPRPPPSDRFDERELGAIESVAADWLVRRDRGLTSPEEQELARWLAVDRRHAPVFQALEETWELMGKAGEASIPARREMASIRRSARWLPLALAAAAALMAGIFWWSTLSTGPRHDVFAMSASTELGALRELALPDGSAVQLNTESEITVQFTAAERRVRLIRGEAHFAIAHNPARPFIVTASGVDVRAVGTAFNVRVRPTAVEVLVTEGKVHVADSVRGDSLLHPTPAPSPGLPDAAGSPPVLAAGEKAVVQIKPAAPPAPAPIAPLAPQAIKQALAWRDRRLDFESTPLAEIVAEMNRYNRHKLVIADPRLEQERFGGSFPANDSEPFVRLLERNFGVAAERRANETLLRLAH